MSKKPEPSAVAVRGVELGPCEGARVGDPAPDFDLPVLLSGVKGRLRLQDQFTGKRIVLAFYPGNWEEVSARQMAEYQAQRDRFREENAEVIGISVDSIMNTTVWEREIGPLDFPLCSDFWPHGSVSDSYGVLRREGENQGRSERAIVVVNPSGTVVFRKVYKDSVQPPLPETWEALRAA